MSESLVMVARIRKATEFNVASDFVTGLSSKVVEMIRFAEENAKGKGKKTLQVSDLPSFEPVIEETVITAVEGKK